MKQIIPLIDQDNKPKRMLFSYFASLKNGFDQIGDEKLRVFYLLGRLAKEKFSFEQYLEGAMTFLSNSEKSFIETRSDELLIWLLERFIPNQESKDFKENCSVHTFTHTIAFPFRTKEVLSIFVEVKNSILDFDDLKKMILDINENITFVNGSFISAMNQRDKISKIHLEVQKEDFFLEDNIDKFQEGLLQTIEDFIEKPKNQLIVPGNRELLIKSFKWIIKDLKETDLPHVLIDFSRQTSNSLQFSALVCCSRKRIDPPLKNRLNHSDISIDGTSYYEEKEIIKEGVVLTLDISAAPSLSIIDARKKSYLIIKNLIGTFRDVNGGLLEKIEHNFNLLCKAVDAPIDDLKHFFYGIIPQEKQATAPISLLKKVYLSMSKKLDQEIDYFVKEDKSIVCITVKMTHPEFEKEFRRIMLNKFSDLLIASIYVDGVTIISCALQKNDRKKSEYLKHISFSFYNDWKEKKELKQILKLGSATQFSSLDPRIGTEEDSSYLLKMLFEGLTKIGEDGLPKKALAKRIEISKSGLIYRFFLRKSYWSDKTCLTAHDFAYSWKTSLSPDFLSPLCYLFYPIENAQAVKEGKLPASELGIKVIDNFTLEVKLQYPTPYFLELCANSAFSPICKATDARNPSWPRSQGKDYVCNGPFVVDVTDNKNLILNKNELFWEKKKIKLEKVIISHVPENELLSLFQDKKLDALLFPFCRNQTLRSSTQNIQKKKAVTAIRYLSFNCSKPLFANKKMRLAFSLALQKEKLAQAFSEGAIPYYAPYDPNFTQLNLNKENEENKDFARKLFSEALIEMNLKPDVFNQEVIYANLKSNGIESLIAKQLNETLGINLRSEVADEASFFSLVRKKSINIFIYAWVNKIQDPNYFLNTFSSSKNIINYTCWENQELISIIKNIQKNDNLEVRQKLHCRAEEILYQEKPLIPLMSFSSYSLLQPEISGIYIGSSLEFDIRYCHKK